MKQVFEMPREQNTLTTQTWSRLKIGDIGGLENRSALAYYKGLLRSPPKVIKRHTGTITVRKRTLRRLCFYTCLSFCPRGGGVQAKAHGGCLPRPGVCVYPSMH